MCFLFVSAWDLLITQKPVYSRRYTVYQAKYITNNPADDYSLYSHENAAVYSSLHISFFVYTMVEKIYPAEHSLNGMHIIL